MLKFAKENLKLLLAAALIVVFIFSASYSYASSGVPSIISYQGRLSDSSGNLLPTSGSSATYYFKFSIWDDSDKDSGTQLWPSPSITLLSFPITVRQGVFNVNIGDTTAGYDYPHALNYDFNTNKNVYLEVRVSSDNSTFQTLSPRQRISSAVFAQISGAVSGTGQSSFGTTTPVSNAVVTVEATSTSAIPVLIRAFAGQVANLFRIEDSSLGHLFSINSSGGIFASSTLNVSGATNLYSALKVSDVNSVSQLRLGQIGYNYGEFHVDSLGDVLLSSNSGNGGNIRMQTENLWVCSDNCDVVGKPSGAGDTGNIILEKALFFDNNFKLAPTTTPGVAEVTMYASSTLKIVPVLIFDDLEE